MQLVTCQWWSSLRSDRGEERDNSNVQNEPPTEAEICVGETIGNERLVLEDRVENNKHSSVRDLLWEVK